MIPKTFEQNISYSIENVKNAMNYILENFKTTFINQNVNEVFNTYSFALVKCNYSVTLTKIDENTTNVKISCAPNISVSNEFDESQNGQTMIYINEFLNILTAKLEGKSDDEISNMVKKSDNNTGCFVSAIVIIGSIITLFILLGLI